jgi:hypothetical protein
MCKDIDLFQPHSTLILAFVLGVVSAHTRSDTNTLRYFSSPHFSLACINMKLPVCTFLYDLGLQKHGHELDYFFMACTVLALFFHVAALLINNDNEGILSLIDVVVIYEVLFCQPRSFFVEVIDFLQVHSELSPISPSFFALVARWLLTMLFGDTSAVFEYFTVLPSLSQ